MTEFVSYSIIEVLKIDNENEMEGENMLHHTTDPAERAGHIAEREAGIVWEETGNGERFFRVLEKTYRRALIEFTPPSPDLAILTS